MDPAASCDPFALLELPPELVHHVCAFLAPAALLRLALACTYLSRVARQDSLWRPHCEELWRGKLLSKPQRIALASKDASDWRRHYYLSLKDSTRCRISKTDLCDNYIWMVSASWQRHDKLRPYGRFMASGTYLGVYGEWPWRWILKDAETDEDIECTEELAQGVQIGPFWGFLFARLPNWGWEVSQEGFRLTAAHAPFSDE